MTRFNSDVIFIDTSGQVVARSGDLTLRTLGGELADLIAGTSGALRPEQASLVDLGRDFLPWKHLYADGGSFATRPTAGGSGVLLQGEIHGELASYADNSFIAAGAGFTPIGWDQTIVEEAPYSRAGSTVTVLQDGVYEVGFSVNLARLANAASLLVECRLTVNGGSANAFRGFTTFYPDVSAPLQTAQISTQLALPLSAGDTLQVGTLVLLGTGSLFHLFGSTLTLKRR